MNKLFLILFGILVFTGCSSQSIMPEKDDITVSRKEADKEDCKFISKVTGTSSSAKGTPKEVLEDMKQDAANKGANYIVVEKYSATGTAVTGKAYKCN